MDVDGNGSSSDIGYEMDMGKWFMGPSYPLLCSEKNQENILLYQVITTKVITKKLDWSLGPGPWKRYLNTTSILLKTTVVPIFVRFRAHKPSSLAML